MNRRLPPHTRRALAALWQAIETSEYDQRQGLPEDRAKRVLASLDEDRYGEEGELDPLPPDEVEYRLEFLQNHGEIYFVDDWVRLTDPEEVATEFVEDDGEND